MGYKIKYKSITRVESCLVEEKIDGSSLSWCLDENNQLHFYSAKEEIFKETCDSFFAPFMEFLETKWKSIEEKYKWTIEFQESLGGCELLNGDLEEGKMLLNLLLTPNIIYCAEALGIGHIKYFDKNEPIENKLYIFDIKGISGKYYKREFVEKLMEMAGLKIVPLTEFNTKESKLNPNVLREGIILRYEDIAGLFEKDGTRDVIKLKLVERKSGKKQKILMEIKELI